MSGAFRVGVGFVHGHFGRKVLISGDTGFRRDTITVFDERVPISLYNIRVFLIEISGGEGVEGLELLFEFEFLFGFEEESLFVEMIGGHFACEFVVGVFALVADGEDFGVVVEVAGVRDGFSSFAWRYYLLAGFFYLSDVFVR